MLVTKLLSFWGKIFMKIFSLFSITRIPAEMLSSAYNFLDILFSHTQLLGLFIRVSTLKWSALFLIFIYNYERIIKFVKNIFTSIFFNKVTGVLGSIVGIFK